MMSNQLTKCWGFEKYPKTTHREQFLSEMDNVVPWRHLCALIALKYPRAGNRGPPKTLERMLRINFLQHWFNPSGSGVEDALSDLGAMSGFVSLDLGQRPAPDEITVRQFFYCLERHDLGAKRFQRELDYLKAHGIEIGHGTIGDALVISVPQLIKNIDRTRELGVHQTKQGNQGYFGINVRIGVHGRTKFSHVVTATAANVHDVTCVSDLLHGEETQVWGDSTYIRQGDVVRANAPRALDIANCRYRRKGVVDEVERAKNKSKSSVRAKVEHLFLVVKRVVGIAQTGYRGLEKSAH